MTPFIHDDFLLNNPFSRTLYHEFAEPMPIVDYHCHLSPKLMAANEPFANMTQAWLVGDHYKWRAMRAAGVPENLITGEATDREKFQAWAETVPKTLRNPLYHWTHLELRRPFGIDDVLLSGDTAELVWQRCNEKLAADGMTPLGILRKMNVEIVCTTDDPVDSLEYHDSLAATATVKVLPTFRPDKALSVPTMTPTGSTDPTECVRMYNQYLDQLGATAGITITCFDDLLESLHARHDFFHEKGCRLSDHAFGQFMFQCLNHTAGGSAITSTSTSAELTNSLFIQLRNGGGISPEGAVHLQSILLGEIAKWNHHRQWTMQIHYGVKRNNNVAKYIQLGPDSGFDSMVDGPIAEPLSRFLNTLARTEQLPQMIFYNLNPSDNDVLATMIGNFQDGTIPGKMQFGSGWWFLDQKEGMERQLNALSSYGLLSQFVGMLTDSRSFLSYTRHEYFRRILCNLLGTEMASGLLPSDIGLVGRMVQDISYHNAMRYFQF